MYEILVWLLVKHFICDFPLQSHPYLYSHKGEYGHPGGIVHALIHGVGTWLVLALLPGIGMETALIYAGLDMVLHYHIDWAKMKTNKVMGWGPTTSNKFWVLVGFDQLLHNLTYAGIAYGVSVGLFGRVV